MSIKNTRGHRLHAVILAVTGLILPVAVTAPVLASASYSPNAQTRAQWQRAIVQLPGLAPGCYHASYPALTWHAVRCQVAPRWLMRPASAPRTPASAAPQLVGSGKDYSAKVSGTISEATGLFDDVSKGITETGQVDNSGPQRPNTYSLQLNSQFFSSPACAGSSHPSRCQGWQQFLYATDSNSIFMQYWLIGYGTRCPKGWFQAGTDCVVNSPAATYAGGHITAAELASTALSGTAVKGGNDQVALSSGSGQASLVVKSDRTVDLAQHWNTAEFGVFGDGGGAEANFGKNTTLDVQTSVVSTGYAAPACVKEGFTGETNNLKFTSTPRIGPQGSQAIVSAQTNGPATTASCATVGGPVKAALLDPRGGCRNYAPGWKDLSNHWKSYGTTPLAIDAKTFCDTSARPITYAALVADNPRVLVLSAPAGGHYQFTPGEIAAITRYVKAGHNLVGTYLTFESGSVVNTGLARLFGLAPSFSPSRSAVTPHYSVIDPVWPLFRKVPKPYDSAGYHFTQVPAGGTWGTSALDGATYVARTKGGLAAITSYLGAYQATYISSMPELSPGKADLQFLYNALTQDLK
jgi:hypothetical protein